MDTDAPGCFFIKNIFEKEVSIILILEKLIKVENEYTKKFSCSMENNDIIRFWDNNITDMYTLNYTLIKKNKNIKQIILKEIEERVRDNKDFLRIEANFPIDAAITDDLPVTAEVTIYDFMYIETNKSPLLKGNCDCIIKEAKTPEILQDGIEVDILANAPIMGDDFAKRRIHRKSQIYRQTELGLSLYVIYHDNIPIGNVEVLIHDGIAKIEDFDIVEQYQRKGFGTAMLKHLLKQAEKSGVSIAYLITDASDTAKEMYEKCNFTKIGEKTELFFNLKV